MNLLEQLKNIDQAFKHIRLFSIVVTIACLATCCYAIKMSYQMVNRAEQRIYLIANGKAIEAFSAARKDNIPVEAKDHIKMFHHYFFTLDPDEKVIHDHISKALYLADGSARSKYEDLKEDRYYAGIISGNISQHVQMDSIRFNMDRRPYYFKYYGTEKIIRPTVTLTRSLITEGFLRSVSRSDHNPHGFLIERWRVLENKDQQSSSRTAGPGMPGSAY